MALTHFR
jgi:diacylglycerol kinase (ATP)